MKILFVTDLYPVNTRETTTPVTLHNFVFEWIKQGHEVTVLKPNFILNSFLRGKPFYFSGFYEYEGIKIYNINYFTPFYFDVLKKIPKEIKYKDYDLIIGHMPSGIIVANKIARIIRKPLVCGVHCSDLEILINPFYSIYFKGQLKEAYKRAHRIACRSRALQKKFSNILPEYSDKTFVAASGIDFFVDVSPFKTINPEKIKVMTCANLVLRKNIDKLIYAVKDLKEFELTVIGDGPQLESLKKIESQNVKFLGRLPRESVLQEMQKHDIFVLPSVNETFGMVYLEAMASGCITVCTKNDGIDGIIKDGENGFLCEPDPENIKQSLLRIKNSHSLQTIIKNSIETARQYSIEDCAQNYLINCRIQN